MHKRTCVLYIVSMHQVFQDKKNRSILNKKFIIRNCRKIAASVACFDIKFTKTIYYN